MDVPRQPKELQANQKHNCLTFTNSLPCPVIIRRITNLKETNMNRHPAISTITNS